MHGRSTSKHASNTFTPRFKTPTPPSNFPPQRHYELHRDRALARAQAAAETMLAEAAGRLSTAARLKESWPEVRALLGSLFSLVSTSPLAEPPLQHQPITITKTTPQPNATESQPNPNRIHQVLAEFDATIAQYTAHAAGPTKWPRLVAFLQQQYAHATTEWMERQAAAAAAKIREEQVAGRDAVYRLKDAEAKAARVSGRRGGEGC